jgi:hypothetical protein
MTDVTRCSIEADLEALLDAGHSRTRATEILIERATIDAFDAAIVVLVEGVSDWIVLEVVAARQGRNLRDEGVAIVPMGGATNIRRYVELFGPRGRRVRLCGLYDAAEERHIRTALDAVGMDGDLSTLGFFSCEPDLEGELLRRLGRDRLEEIIERHGELSSFRTMQKEPFHRGRNHEQQLYSFVRGRNYRYARRMAEALDLTDVPSPIAEVLRIRR